MFIVLTYTELAFIKLFRSQNSAYIQVLFLFVGEFIWLSCNAHFRKRKFIKIK